MNAKSVRKWIARNAPDYRLVRTQYVETIHERAADAEALVVLRESRIIELNDRLREQEVRLRNLAAELAVYRVIPAELLAEAGIVVGGPGSVIAADKVEEGSG